MTARWNSAGELAWPHWMSNAPYSFARFFDHAGLPLVSSATNWPVPNHA